MNFLNKLKLNRVLALILSVVLVVPVFVFADGDSHNHSLLYTDNGDGTHTISCEGIYDSESDTYLSCDFVSTTEDHIFEEDICVCGAVCGKDIPEPLEDIDSSDLLYTELEYTIDDIIIKATGDIPDGAELVVNPVEIESVQELVDEYKPEGSTFTIHAAYDIKIKVGDEIFEPEDFNETVVISITSIEKTDALVDQTEALNVMHISDDETNVEILEDVVVKNSTVEFETDSFSTFVIGSITYDTEACVKSWNAGHPYPSWPYDTSTNPNSNIMARLYYMNNVDDSEGYLLVLTGSGPVCGWSGRNYAPWSSYRESIKKIIVEDGITTIGRCAFGGCSALKEVELPSTLTTIYGGAFEDCSSLLEVDFPANVTTIGSSNAFANCTSLTSIKGGAGLTSIASGTFKVTTISRIQLTSDASEALVNYDWTSDNRIVSDEPYVDAIAQWNDGNSSGNYTMYNSSAETDSNVVAKLFFADEPNTGYKLVFSGSGVIAGRGNQGSGNWWDPNGIDVNPWSAYSNQITQIVIEDGITEIGMWACAGTQTTSIYIPDSVTTIDKCAFALSPSLTTITGAKNVASMPSAGYGDSFDIGKTAKGAFVVKESTPIYIDSGASDYFKYNYDWSADLRTYIESGSVHKVFDIGDSTGALESATVSTGDDNVKAYVDSVDDADPNKGLILTISGSGNMMGWNSESLRPWNTFENNIVRVVITDGVTSLGARLFAAWDVEIEIAGSIESIGEMTFYQCPSLIEYTATENLLHIGKMAFASSSVGTVDLSASHVTKLEQATFKDCTQMTTCKLPGVLTTLYTNVYAGTDLTENGVFENCSALTELIIPDSVTVEWQGQSFGGEMPLLASTTAANCTSLEHIHFGSGLRQMISSSKNYGPFANSISLNRISGGSGFKTTASAQYSSLQFEDMFYAETWRCVALDSVAAGVEYFNDYNWFSDHILAYDEDTFNIIGDGWNVGNSSGTFTAIDSKVTADDNVKAYLVFIDTSDISAGVKLVFRGSGPMAGYTDAEYIPYVDYFNSDFIKQIVIEDGITVIGQRVCAGLPSATRLDIGKDVTTVGTAAFLNCPNLVQVNGATSVTTMPTAGSTTGAFYVDVIADMSVDNNASVTFKSYDWNTDNRHIIVDTDSFSVLFPLKIVLNNTTNDDGSTTFYDTDVAIKAKGTIRHGYSLVVDYSDSITLNGDTNNLNSFDLHVGVDRDLSDSVDPYENNDFVHVIPHWYPSDTTVAGRNGLIHEIAINNDEYTFMTLQIGGRVSTPPPDVYTGNLQFNIAIVPESK